MVVTEALIFCSKNLEQKFNFKTEEYGRTSEVETGKKETTTDITFHDFLWGEKKRGGESPETERVVLLLLFLNTLSF